MESNIHYFLRRAASEAAAARIALTPAARDRRELLAAQFTARARECAEALGAR